MNAFFKIETNEATIMFPMNGTGTVIIDIVDGDTLAIEGGVFAKKFNTFLTKEIDNYVNDGWSEIRFDVDSLKSKKVKALGNVDTGTVIGALELLDH